MYDILISDTGFNIPAATDLEYASLGSSRYEMMQIRMKMSAVMKNASALSVTSSTAARSTMDATALSVPPIACPGIEGIIEGMNDKINFQMAFTCKRHLANWLKEHLPFKKQNLNSNFWHYLVSSLDIRNKSKRGWHHQSVLRNP